MHVFLRVKHRFQPADRREIRELKKKLATVFFSPEINLPRHQQIRKAIFPTEMPTEFRTFEPCGMTVFPGKREKGNSMTIQYHRASPFVETISIFLASILLASCDVSDKSNNGEDGGLDDNSKGGSENGDHDICEGDLAEETFRFALCTCRNATALGLLTTGSFDSAFDVINTANVSMLNVATPSADDYGAALGVNLNLSVPGLLNIGGTAIWADPI